LNSPTRSPRIRLLPDAQTPELHHNLPDSPKRAPQLPLHIQILILPEDIKHPPARAQPPGAAGLGPSREVTRQSNQKQTKKQWETFFFQIQPHNHPAAQFRSAHSSLQPANLVLAFLFWITLLLTWLITPKCLL